MASKMGFADPSQNARERQARGALAQPVRRLRLLAPRGMHKWTFSFAGHLINARTRCLIRDGVYAF
jgi:hypothetical protein